jgi:flagellar biosynthetic protein FliR
VTALLAELMGLAEDVLVIGGIVFLRVGAMMAVLPAFGERSVPERVRLALGLAFTAIVAPAATQSVVAAQDAGTAWIIFLGSEVLIGLLLGLAIRLFVLALQTAGAIAAQATSLAQIFGNVIVDPQPAMAHVMIISGLALAVMLGLHIKVVEFLMLSYDLFPPGRFPTPNDVMGWGVGQIGRMFGLAFILAAPFVIVSLLYNLSLGVINRAMPQLMVAFVGAPAITAGALILLAVALPFLLAAWIAAMDGFFANPFGGF